MDTLQFFTKPMLYSKSSTGKIQEWVIEVKKLDNETDESVIIVKAGQQGGKKTTHKTIITKGKNIGRSNETTPFEQACKEALSKWENKKKKAVENIEQLDDESVFIKPLLAKVYKDHKNKVEYPVYTQEKFNGVRGVAVLHENKALFFSRNGKVYNIPYISKELLMVYADNNCPNIMFDGEIYLHGVPLEYIAGCMNRKSSISKLKDKVGCKLQYWIYDIYDKDNKNMTFKKRNKLLNNLDWREYKYLKIANTDIAKDESKLISLFNQYIENGYEGLMVRNKNGIYKPGARSSDLLKLKSFMDAEYEIVGYNEGRGKYENVPIWVCKTEDGSKFNVTPKGNMEHKKYLFDNADSMIGKLLTVQYAELTTKGTPRFGIGITIRDYE